MSSNGTSFTIHSFVVATGFELPFEVDAATLNEFDHMEVAVEAADGRTFGIIDDDARDFIENGILGLDGVLSTFSLEDRSFRVCGIEQPAKETTLNVPLAWLNRIVKIWLADGEVVGILGDQFLRDPEYVCIMTLPGKPPCPPIPAHLVRSISLMPLVFCCGCERSVDEECEVRKYLYQRGEHFYFKELHTTAGRSLVSEDHTFYHMEYHYKVDEEARATAEFYRWPLDDKYEADAAENDDWRLRWAASNRHHLVGECLQEVYHHAFDEEAEPAVSESITLRVKMAEQN